MVVYGKDPLDSLSAERDRLKRDIQTLKDTIQTTRQTVRKFECRIQAKQRFLHRLNYICKRKR